MGKHVKAYRDWSYDRIDEWENEIFRFMTLEFDIELAEKMIRENPAKYKSPDGELYTIDLDNVRKLINVLDDEPTTGTQTFKIHAFGTAVKSKHAREIMQDDERMKEPGIWLNWKEKEFSYLIDGWHRAYAHILRGDKEMRVWVIEDPADIKRILVR